MCRRGLIDPRGSGCELPLGSPLLVAVDGLEIVYSIIRFCQFIDTYLAPS